MLKNVTRLLLLCLLTLVVASAQAAHKTPVVIDTDIGDDIDDTWALALALRCPELDVKLVVGDYGKPDYRARLIARLLETAKRSDIPVGVGMEFGKGQQMRQGKWIASYDLKQYPGKVHQDGVKAIIDVIMESPEPVTLLGIGPAPNLAEALRRNPRIAQKARFVGMYGSVRIGYAGAPKPAPEWNVKADIASCQQIFAAPWDMTITPLDTCGLVQLKDQKYAAVFNSKDPLIKALVENYKLWEEFNAAKGDKKQNAAIHSTTLYDCVAIYLAITNDLCRMEKLNLLVDDQGYTREDPKGKAINSAMAWKDLPGFEDWLVHRLTQ